jgi:Fe-S-cluster-containing dehydrogenase component
MPASFLFDANRCTGCGACQVACTIENGLAADVSWRRIETFNPRRHPAAPVFHLSLACNHCATAACMSACPALAYRRDSDTGAVLLDPGRCIGCGYCSWACPYDAPVFDERQGVMTKCTWCAERLRAGLKPACAVHCPTGALDFGPVPASGRTLSIDGLPQTALEPSLHAIPLKAGRTQPEMTAGEVAAPVAPPPPARMSDISLAREWPLAAFTLMTAVLVAAFTVAVSGTLHLDVRVFAAAATLAMGLASAHLGRKARAWRAGLNLRRSWLSREVVATSAFFVFAALWLAFGNDQRTTGLAVAALGFVALLSADEIYGVLPGGAGYRHSAGVLWTGVFLASALMREPEIAVVVGFGKLWGYTARKRRFFSAGRPTRPLLSVVRVGAGLVIPFALWTMGPAFGGVALALLLTGEIVDRIEFYLELERESPRRQMAMALARRVAGRTPSPDRGPATPAVATAR